MKYVRIGCFRAEKSGGEAFYVSYDEFRNWDEDARLRMRERVQKGDVRLFCACRTDDRNPLTITATGVIRVASNCNQDNHAESCPKSEVYAGWAAQSKKGLLPLHPLEEDDSGRLCFNLSLPPLFSFKIYIFLFFGKWDGNSKGKEDTPHGSGNMRQ